MSCVTRQGDFLQSWTLARTTGSRYSALSPFKDLRNSSSSTLSRTHRPIYWRRPRMLYTIWPLRLMERSVPARPADTFVGSTMPAVATKDLCGGRLPWWDCEWVTQQDAHNCEPIALKAAEICIGISLKSLLRPKLEYLKTPSMKLLHRYRGDEIGPAMRKEVQKQFREWKNRSMRSTH